MRGVANPERNAALEKRKEALEAKLRAQFEGQSRDEIKAHPIIAAYNAYYKQFRKTYHVQHQLESVALKGRSMPRTAALVEAMFMAELENLLLTAGHDLDVVAPPITIDIAAGSETYVGINDQRQTLKANDMFIADSVGVISSILYGPDRRTMIRPETESVVFTVYAVKDVPTALLAQHLTTLQENVRVIAPQAEVELSEVYLA